MYLDTMVELCKEFKARSRNVASDTRKIRRE